MTTTSQTSASHCLHSASSLFSQGTQGPPFLAGSQPSLAHPNQNSTRRLCGFMILLIWIVFFGAEIGQAVTCHYVLHNSGPRDIGAWQFRDFTYQPHNTCASAGWSDWLGNYISIPNMTPGQSTSADEGAYDYDHMCPAPGMGSSNRANMSYTVLVSGKDRLDVYIDGTGVPDNNDRPPCENSGCSQCGGMPVWSVSEPYLNV